MVGLRMIIEVKKLNALKQYRGRLNFSFQAASDLIDIPYVKFSTPVHVEGEFFLLEDDSVEVEATLSYGLKGLCSRCLREAEAKITYVMHEYFVSEDNGEDYIYENGVVDLRQALQDAVLLSLPSRLLCGQADCEENLNL